MLFNKGKEELKFRLRRESLNLKNYLKPPRALPVVMRPILPPAKEVVEALRQSSIVAECLYHGFRLRRRMLFRKREGLILLCDLVDGDRSVEHEVEKIW